jgi:iron complex outermembrane recepter protein
MYLIVRSMRAAWVALLVGAAPGAAQQSGVIEGRIVSAETGTPLPDAQIRLDGTNRGAMSDAAGHYRIGAVPAGDYIVVVQRVGVATERRAVTVTPAATVRADFRLREAATTVAPVVVSATRELQRRSEASATIDVLDGAEVRRARAAHPSGIMNRLAGVHVSELSGEGHSMAIRQPITTKPMYLFLEDGIPTRATGFFNHNALYEVNIPQSGGIEVLKGPGTALYGSDAIGGVVNVLTRPAPATPGLDVSAEGGAYGYNRVLLSGGTMTSGHGFRADVNVTGSDNWKDDAPFRRQSGTLRWDAFNLRGWSARTVLTASNIDQQDVPALTEAQYQTDIGLNRAPIAYRKVQAVRLSSALERENANSSWSFTPFARYNVLDLLPSWQLTFDPQTWDTRNTSLGLLAKYRRDFAPLRSRLIVGADADLSPGSFFARQAVTTQTDGRWLSYMAGEIHYDYDVTYKAVSPYVHLEASPVSRLRIDAGLRADFAGYDYTNNLTPLETGPHRRPGSTSVSYSHLSPKLGASLEISPAVNAFASYRHGFRAPSQGQLFQQNSAANTVELDPVTVDSYEIGLRGQPTPRLVYQVSAYDMTVRDDILVYRRSQTERVATNAGETRHRGVEASVGVALVPRLRLDASYAVAEQRYVEWQPQPGTSYAGNDIEVAPRDLGNILLTWTPPLLKDGRMAIEWSKTGRYALDPENTDFGGAYELLNLHFNVNLRPNVELFARAINVLDRQYAEVLTSDAFQGRQYTPGAPRSIYAGLRYGWQQ